MSSPGNEHELPISLILVHFGPGTGPAMHRHPYPEVFVMVGSTGDSYDNALAESFHGLYKAELIRHQGPWHGLDDVEYATLEYVDWFNHRRLHGELGLVPPAEFEAAYYERDGALPLAASQ